MDISVIGAAVDFLKSSSAAVSVAIITIFSMYAKFTESKLFMHLSWLKANIRKRKNAEKMLALEYMDEDEKKTFTYDLKKIDYSNYLNVSTTLPAMQYLAGCEYVEGTIFRFKQCQDDLIFDEENQKFKSKKPLNDEFKKRAKKKKIAGLFFFGLLMIIAYLVLLVLFDLLESLPDPKIVKVAIGIVVFIAYSVVLYINFQIFKWFLKDHFLLNFISKPPQRKSVK